MFESIGIWKDWSIDDLQVIKSEEFIDDDGEVYFCIYSLKLDSVTFVSSEVFQYLQKLGIKEIQSLPN